MRKLPVQVLVDEADIFLVGERVREERFNPHRWVSARELVAPVFQPLYDPGAGQLVAVSGAADDDTHTGAAREGAEQ